MTRILQRPAAICPYLIPGRLVHILEGTNDWGWDNEGVYGDDAVVYGGASICGGRVDFAGVTVDVSENHADMCGGAVPAGVGAMTRRTPWSWMYFCRLARPTPGTFADF
eukprot:2618355-Rhodomonas_salina.1